MNSHRVEPLTRRAIRWLRCGVVLLALMAVETARGQGNAGSQPALERRAIEFLADVTPHGAAPRKPVEVSYQGDRAIWGVLFGDDRIAALVAIKRGGVNQPPGDEADLCLLRWDDGWKFVQQAGQVAATDSSEDWDWEIRQGPDDGVWYVRSHLQMYPPGAHRSWRCDPKARKLVPTGWPEDAVASLARGSITFAREKQPGHSSTVYEIYRFADRVGGLVARCSGSNREVLTAWNPGSGRVETWQVQRTPNYKKFALCRSDGEFPTTPFREDAVAEFDWGDTSDSHSETDYFWQRLTGLSEAALRGEWGGADEPIPGPPRSVVVTGLPDAVAKYRWPIPSASNRP